MKRIDIIQGGLYVAKVNGRLAVVQVEEIRDPHHDHGRMNYRVTNLATGRTTVFRTAVKFRCAVPDYIAKEVRGGRMPAHQAALAATAAARKAAAEALLPPKQSIHPITDTVYHRPSSAHGSACGGCTLDVTKWGKPVVKPERHFNPLPLISTWLDHNADKGNPLLQSRSDLLDWLITPSLGDGTVRPGETCGLQHEDERGLELALDCLIAAGIGNPVEQRGTVYCRASYE
jgi:hypothetical protein